MDAVLEQLGSRKSVRKFLDRPVDRDTRDRVVDAALQAPTAGNQALYAILEIEDPGLRRDLSVACDNQPFIASAPWVLVFLADCRRWPDAYALAGAARREPGPGDLLLAYADAVIAAQNAVVAAHALGLGSCYIGDILENRETVAGLLALDAYTVPAAMLVFGYPTEQQLERPKPPRFDRGRLVLRDRYSPLTEAEQRAMHAERARGDFDFDKEIAAFCERKYLSAFAREMNRSAALYLKPFLDNEAAGRTEAGK